MILQQKLKVKDDDENEVAEKLNSQISMLKDKIQNLEGNNSDMLKELLDHK